VPRHRSLPAVDRPATWRATLFALLALVAIPASAQARDFQIDGRVTGPPAVKRGAVVVPIVVTKRVGRALAFGTTRISVRFRRSERLPLGGSGARGASRLLPSALRVGDRLKGVTSLSNRARLRLRYRLKPTLKLKRARVIRSAPRRRAPLSGLGGPGPFGLPGGALPPGPSAPTPIDQLVAGLQAQTTTLAARVGETGSFPAEVEARDLQLDALKTGIENVTKAFDSLETALKGLEGQVDQAALDELLAEVEALTLRVKALETGIGPIDSALSELRGAISKLDSAVEKLAPTVTSLASQAALIQQAPGAQAELAALAAAAGTANARLDAADAALDSLGGGMDGLVAAMASLVSSIEALAAEAQSGADLATLSAGLDELGADVAALESGNAGLQATGAGLVPTADGIEADALALETRMNSVCDLAPDACP
jgi:uncharacterized protein YoxC